MSWQASMNIFNPNTDQVFIRGNFNNWDTSTPMLKGEQNIYSATIELPENSGTEFKYYITSPGADNSGWEHNFPVAQSGNRVVLWSNKDLNLVPVLFDDIDMSEKLTTSHFVFHFTSLEKTLINEFAQKTETGYTKIIDSLRFSPTHKIDIYLYKNLDYLHLATGYPENGEGSIGSAYGSEKVLMLAPSQMGAAGAVWLLAHELTHTVVAEKTKVQMKSWLNEGIACYFGRNFSTKDWISSVMKERGKPQIEEIFNTEMGYAYAGTIAYFIIKTKGMEAMAKFIENMNHADIGYNDLAQFQAAWHVFLDTYLDYQHTVNVKFSVDMAAMVQAGQFDASKDKVFVKGSFNNWNSIQLAKQAGTVYTVTVPMNWYNFFDYRFYTNSTKAPNGGLELDSDDTPEGNRVLDLEGANLQLPVVSFRNANISGSGIDMTEIDKKLAVLKYHGQIWGNPSFYNFNHPIKVISAAEYETLKPATAMPYDCGFVAGDGTINVSTPTTAGQKQVFPDINKAALYYLCQSYMYFFFQTHEIPLIFSQGFPAFEAGLNIPDETVKTAVNSYGGSFASFDVLNDRNKFIAQNGLAVAQAFGEFMNAFKNWGYPNVITINSTGFDVASWWGNVDNLAGLLADFNRYLKARFLETNENLRIKRTESENFIYFMRLVDAAINFQAFSETLEAAYQEYCTNFNVKAGDKLTFFSLPTCIDLTLEGLSCPTDLRLTGGTAWSSGLHSTCAPSSDLVPFFRGQNRHELAHTFQALLPQGPTTQWLIEGFAFFCDAGPFTDQLTSNDGQPAGYWRDKGITSMNQATAFFGHRPTYEDTKIYPEPDYGYKYLGYFLNDFIYRKGGYTAIKNVQMSDVEGYKKMGYPSAQAFFDDFNFDFDVRVRNLPVVTLKTPATGKELTAPQVSISWAPLKADVKYNVLVSTNNKSSWNEVANRTTETSCVWNSGSYSGQFYLKFVAPDNLNLESVFGPFTVTDLTALNLGFPNGGEYLIAGDTVKITWAKTGISKIKLEYSENNGGNWKTIDSEISTAEQEYNWLVPNTVSAQCKIRLTDATNASKTDVSALTFTILKNNPLGGPYVYDENTVLLMHFDNGFDNRSYLSGDGKGTVQNLVNDPLRSPTMGYCLKTNSPVTVAHTSGLNLNGSWTIEAWVKFNSFYSNTSMTLVTKPGISDPYFSNYTLEVNPWWGNIFYGFYFSTANERIGQTSIAPKLNEWVHVAFIRDQKNSEIRMLVHDKNWNLLSNMASKITALNTKLSTKDLIIGSGMDGWIDELRISNVARSYVVSETEKLIANDGLTIYPNPSGGQIFLQWNDAGNSPVNIQIANVSGTIVYRETFNPDGRRIINLTGCPAGIYFVQAKSSGKTTTQRLILK